jgi:hypothetical protein
MTLNKSISNEGAPAAPGAAQGIRVNIPTVARFQQNGGTTQAPSTIRTQLHADTGLVKVGDYETTPEAAATLQKQAPGLFEAPEVKQAEQAAAEKAEADAEAERAELNRFADDAAEGAAMHIANDVAFADQVALLNQLYTKGQVSEATLNRVADQLHMSVDDTVAALNAVTVNANGQLTALCNTKGVNAQDFSSWMKATRPSDMFKAVQIHLQERDFVRAYGRHLDAYKARGKR